jgi:uncharacterized protein YndB with AHSA1/START domain
LRAPTAPARIVFQAWTRPELFKQWWVPKSMGMVLRSCEIDARVGGRYRLVFGHEAGTGAADALRETFEQLDRLLVTLAA